MTRLDIQDEAYFHVGWRINRLILQQLEYQALLQEVVDVLFTECDADEMGYVLVELLMPDYQRNVLRRVAISKAEALPKLKELLPDLEESVLSLLDEQNVCVKAFREGKMQKTQSWGETLNPTTDGELMQKIYRQLEIRTVYILPLISRDKVLGLLTFDLSKKDEGVDEREKMLFEGIADAAAVAIENAVMYGKLQELDKTKDEFLSLAAHELRTPLGAIKGYAYELVRTAEPEGKEMKYATRVYAAADRLTNMVNDMLDISRIETGRIELKMANVILKEVIAEGVAEILPKAEEKGVAISFSDGGVTSVVGDNDKLIQVLVNLIGNAVKFTPNGGKVEILVRPVNGKIQIDVIDSGVGMDKEDLGKLFGKFVRVKSGEGVQGTGLGLYLSKRMVELMGGEMWADSKGPGQGSVFSFTLRTT